MKLEDNERKALEDKKKQEKENALNALFEVEKTSTIKEKPSLFEATIK